MVYKPTYIWGFPIWYEGEVIVAKTHGWIPRSQQGPQNPRSWQPSGLSWEDSWGSAISIPHAATDAQYAWGRRDMEGVEIRILWIVEWFATWLCAYLLVLGGLSI